MPNSIASPALSGKRKMLSASFAPPKAQGESLGQKLSDDEIARNFGRLIERSLALASKDRQDLQGALDYAHQTSVSKLIHPAEATPIMRALAIDWFSVGFLLALAESLGVGVRVKTVVEIDRRAVSA